LDSTSPARTAVHRPNAFSGTILRVDKFGNLVTNLRPEHVPPLFQADPPEFSMRLGEGEVRALHATFAQGLPGEVFAVLGSMDFSR